MVDVGAGFVDGEPLGAVDFWEFDVAAGAWGPLDADEVAGEGGGVAIARAGEGGDGFAAGLPDGAEGVEWAGGGEAGFFGEFADGGFEGLLGWGEFAFGDGPCAAVFLCEERAAGMDEEDFEAAWGLSVEDEAGALFGHGLGVIPGESQISPLRCEMTKGGVPD